MKIGAIALAVILIGCAFIICGEVHAVNNVNKAQQAAEEVEIKEIDSAPIPAPENAGAAIAEDTEDEEDVDTDA